MKLSENFSLAEFTKSATAIRHGIDNIPGPRAIGKLQGLVDNVLQPLRDWHGKSIRVESGYRCPALNAAVRGASTSQHMDGEAGDIETKGDADNGKLFNYIRENLPFDQLIWEYGDDENPAWIHVSHRTDGENRGQVLRAFYKPGGGVKYVII